MSKIYWDTMLFVYLLEGSPQYSPKVAKIYTAMQQRGDRLYSSALAKGEILIKPLQQERPGRADAVEDFFAPENVTLLSFSASTARKYAEIRAQWKVRPPDAIHLACAAEAGIDLFLTNDQALIGKHVEGIQFIAGLDVNLF